MGAEARLKALKNYKGDEGYLAQENTISPHSSPALGQEARVKGFRPVASLSLPGLKG